VVCLTGCLSLPLVFVCLPLTVFVSGGLFHAPRQVSDEYFLQYRHGGTSGPPKQVRHSTHIRTFDNQSNPRARAGDS
jgi:hypothetical protein